MGLVVLLVTFLAFTISLFPGEPLLKISLKSCFPWIIRMLSHNKLISFLWTNGHDDIKEEKSERITIAFPNTPVYFSRVFDLIIRNKLSPIVAAVPQALYLNRDEVSAQGEKAIANLNLKLKKLDPILYVKEDGFTAVLSSFGEFAPEQKVLKWIRRKGLKLCLN